MKNDPTLYWYKYTFFLEKGPLIRQQRYHFEKKNKLHQKIIALNKKFGCKRRRGGGHDKRIKITVLYK